MRKSSFFFGAVTLLALSLTSITGCADLDDEEDVSAASELKGKKKKNNESPKNDDKPQPHRFSVIQHNIGGGAENVGTAEALAYTFAQIDEKKPDVVMLQEVCTDQLDAFKARYPTWGVRFKAMRATHVGCGGKPKGQVLASPRGLQGYDEHDLGDPDGDKVFTLMCAGVPMPQTQRSVLACVTHMHVGSTDPDESARSRQAARIAQTLNDDVNGGRAVVIGGDLNAGPHKSILDPIYRLTLDGKATGGKFDEADQTDANRGDYAKREVTCAPDACRSGADTTDGYKLDYVFFSHNRAAGVGAQVMGRGGSGHHLYHAWGDLDL